MLTWITALRGLSEISKALSAAYERRENAETERERIAADVEIQDLKSARDIRVAQIKNFVWYSPRSLMAYCVTIFVFKLLVWDTVLGWGTTQNPGDIVLWIVVTVIASEFVSTSGQKIADTIASAIIRRRK